METVFEITEFASVFILSDTGRLMLVGFLCAAFGITSLRLALLNDSLAERITQIFRSLRIPFSEQGLAIIDLIVRRAFMVFVLATASITILQIALSAANSGANWQRETIVVIGSLVLIVFFSALTIYYTPARMTVIAGIAIGLILAVFMVEAFLWINGYMSDRVNTASVIDRYLAPYE